MTDRQPINPYQVSQPPAAAPPRRFPWLSTVFFVFSCGCILFAVTAIGQMRGVPFPTPMIVAAVVFGAAILLLAPTLLFAGIMRLIFSAAAFAFLRQLGVRK